MTEPLASQSLDIDALATGKVSVKPLLADAYPIAEFDQAMEASLSGGVLKNLIVP